MLQRILATYSASWPPCRRQTEAASNSAGSRQTLGYLPQEFGGYPKVNAEDLLDHFAILKGIAGR